VKFKRVFGDKHYLTLKTIYNLARILSEEGDLVEAKKLFLRAIEINISIFGKNHI
jgi:Tetratricopeptide repeat